MQGKSLEKRRCRLLRYSHARYGRMKCDLLFKDSVKQKSFAVISPRRGVKEALLDYRVLQDAVLNGSRRPRARHAAHGTLPPDPLPVRHAWPSAARRRQYGSRERGCTTALCCRLAFFSSRRTRPSSLRLRRRARFSVGSLSMELNRQRDGTRRLSFLHGMRMILVSDSSHVCRSPAPPSAASPRRCSPRGSPPRSPAAENFPPRSDTAARRPPHPS